MHNSEHNEPEEMTSIELAGSFLGFLNFVLIFLVFSLRKAQTNILIL